MNRKERRSAKSQSGSSQALQGMFAEAAMHLQAGRLAEAEQGCRQILVIDPRHADSLHMRGLIAHQRGQHADAGRLIEQAIRIDRKVPVYHNNLGISFSSRRMFGEAAESYKRAISLQPDYTFSHYGLGSAFQELGRLEEAVASYKRAVELKPDYLEAHINMGAALNEQGKSEEAVLHYRQAIALKPDFAEAHYNLGTVLNDQGKHADAEGCYRHAIAIKPSFIQAHINLGTSLKEQGKLDEAVTCFRSAIIFNPEHAETHYRLGAALSSQGKSDGALAHLHRYLELDPADRQGARLLLAGQGAGPIPGRASEAHLQSIYASRAKSWDQKAAGDLSYYAHELVAGAFEQLRDQSKKPDILDAGCGTGLVGALVRHAAGRLEGIDLAPAMLEKAKARGIYDQLHQADLVKFLAQEPGKYDVITCAATLIHFGDLHPAFEAAAIALRNNGLFICTLFPNDNEQDGNGVAVSALADLAQGGCYAHGRNYIRDLAAETGFAVELLDTKVHEYNKGNPVMGLIVALRRTS